MDSPGRTAMTHRERVLTALSHREPDRVPIDFGSTRVTAIHIDAYQKLKRYLGVEAPDRLIDRVQLAVAVDEPILKLLDIDTRGVWYGGPDNWRDVQLDAETYVDEWGVVRCRPADSYYNDLIKSPLAGEITVKDIANYRWPDPYDPGRVHGLRERLEYLKNETDYAVVLNLAGGVVHISQYLRGFQDWFVDLAVDRALAGALLDAVVDFAVAVNEAALKEVGHLADVVFYGDDVGQQNGPICSPAAYREVIKPRHARIFEGVRRHTTAPLLYHTCGSVVSILDDIIEIGVNAINPVQTTARGMDPTFLKERFGDRLSFWGGIDTHYVLPHGSREELRLEVEQRIAQLGSGGGYVLNSVHNLQPDVPPENIVAMFEFARALGVYDGAAPRQ